MCNYRDEDADDVAETILNNSEVEWAIILSFFKNCKNDDEDNLSIIDLAIGVHIQSCLNWTRVKQNDRLIPKRKNTSSIC